MTHKDSVLSPNAIFYYFIVSVWSWILLEIEIIIGDGVWGQTPASATITPFLVPPRKPPDLVKNVYGSQTYNLKKRVDIWTKKDVVPVDYGTFAQKFHFTMWFFQFITRITFKCDYVVWRLIAMLVWIGIWIKLRIYRVTTEPVMWSCRSFGFLWRAFMIRCYRPRMNSIYLTESK